MAQTPQGDDAPPLEPSLENLQALSRGITAAQAEVDQKSAARREMIYALHQAGLADYRAMADAMGVTVQTVYRIAPLGKRP